MYSLGTDETTTASCIPSYNASRTTSSLIGEYFDVVDTVNSLHAAPESLRRAQTALKYANVANDVVECLLKSNISRLECAKTRLRELEKRRLQPRIRPKKYLEEVERVKTLVRNLSDQLESDLNRGRPVQTYCQQAKADLAKAQSVNRARAKGVQQMEGILEKLFSGVDTGDKTENDARVAFSTTTQQCDQVCGMVERTKSARHHVRNSYSTLVKARNMLVSSYIYRSGLDYEKIHQARLLTNSAAKSFRVGASLAPVPLGVDLAAADLRNFEGALAMTDGTLSKFIGSVDVALDHAKNFMVHLKFQQTVAEQDRRVACLAAEEAKKNLIQERERLLRNRAGPS